ncbi:hypothetical protein NS331_21385 [Pseudacidovorax intermedius]|uniref:Uncharacterized protein n=2 Tax=Pseudacidovorax intermedius TaxID=433924 RepID=A0A147GMT6_9BURK|nr:hypothetical protein NS331_21385 [Pseudacidovorax intermedius]
MDELKFKSDGTSVVARMADCRISTPDGRHVLELPYDGEPPHGDSYHRLLVDGRVFPGRAWGCNFALSDRSLHVAFSWMPAMLQRKTVVLSLGDYSYCILPSYIHDFSFSWPALVGVGHLSRNQGFVFTGEESWQRF